jgi:hypothetical protein
MILDLRILKELEQGNRASAFAEAAKEGNGVAEHGVVGAGVLHGSIQFAFDAGYGLE